MVKNRGRRSAGALTTVPPPPDILPQRPEAPPALGEDGMRRWDDIVGALPVDYWRPSDLVMLEDMIRTEQFVVECDVLIAEHGQIVPGATGAFVVNPAVTARRGYIATIAT